MLFFPQFPTFLITLAHFADALHSARL